MTHFHENPKDGIQSNALEYCLPPPAELLDEYGIDSDVWRVESNIVKIYTNLEIYTTQKYKEITNMVSSYLHEHPHTQNLHIGDNHYFCEFLVNPINLVDTFVVSPDSLLPKRYPLAQSAFIDGPQVIQLSCPLDEFKKIIESLDPLEQQRLIQFYHDVSQNNLIPFFKNEFEKLSSSLNDLFDIKGIKIIPLNVKLRSPSMGVLQLVITDLCKELRCLLVN